jgi:hypothetical protein
MTDFENASRKTKTVSENDALKKVKKQLSDTGAEVKQRANDVLQSTTEVAQDKLAEATDAAKEAAGATLDLIQRQAREQQSTGADFIERVASNIREAGHAFEKDVPIATRGIDSAADYVEDAAQKIRTGSFRDLLEGATDFAKCKPTAFLGITVLAGFAAIRFLKASGGQSPSSKQGDLASSVETSRWQPSQTTKNRTDNSITPQQAIVSQRSKVT